MISTDFHISKIPCLWIYRSPECSITVLKEEEEEEGEEEEEEKGEEEEEEEEEGEQKRKKEEEEMNKTAYHHPYTLSTMSIPTVAIYLVFFCSLN